MGLPFFGSAGQGGAIVALPCPGADILVYLVWLSAASRTTLVVSKYLLCNDKTCLLVH